MGRKGDKSVYRELILDGQFLSPFLFAAFMVYDLSQFDAVIIV